MFTFARLSLARQFLLASFLILLAGMLIVGAWVAQQIEQGVTQRTAALTALYVDSLVGHHLPPMATTGQLDPGEWEPLDMLFTNSPLGKQTVSFTLWGPGGEILYSLNKSLIGRTFPVDTDLKNAFNGQVSTQITQGNVDQGQPARLLKTFAPVHTNGANSIVAAAEFEQSASDLDRVIQQAQLRSWAVVAAATLAMYLLLAGLVGRASVIISKQQREKQDQVKQLTTLLAQNAALNDRVQRAAARSASVNERFLRRLSSELHDGPCQDLGLALLRIGSLADDCATGEPLPANGVSNSQDFRTIETALQSALAELRTIASGLWLPALESLSLPEAAERAVREYESKTGATVSVSIEELPPHVPLPLKITVYRLLQEALMNGFRHASAAGQRVRIWADDGQLCTQVADSGAGFDPQVVMQNGHLGLVGMRERTELLGGAFEIQTKPGQGTLVQARLPLNLPEDDHE